MKTNGELASTAFRPISGARGATEPGRAHSSEPPLLAPPLRQLRATPPVLPKTAKQWSSAALKSSWDVLIFFSSQSLRSNPC